MRNATRIECIDLGKFQAYLIEELARHRINLANLERVYCRWKFGMSMSFVSNDDFFSGRTALNTLDSTLSLIDRGLVKILCDEASKSLPCLILTEKGKEIALRLKNAEMIKEC